MVIAYPTFHKFLGLNIRLISMLCILAIMPKLMVTSFWGEDSDILAWENSQHLATLRLVSPPNYVWEKSAEIPCWWRVTTQIWVVLLIGWINFSRGTTNQKQYPDLGSDASSVWNFCARFSDVIWRGNQWYCRQMLAVFFRLATINTKTTTILLMSLFLKFR